MQSNSANFSEQMTCPTVEIDIFTDILISKVPSRRGSKYAQISMILYDLADDHQSGPTRSECDRYR